MTDVNPIAGLRNLKSLNLYNNYVTDFSPLSSIPGLMIKTDPYSSPVTGDGNNIKSIEGFGLANGKAVLNIPPLKWIDGKDYSKSGQWKDTYWPYHADGYKHAGEEQEIVISPTDGKIIFTKPGWYNVRNRPESLNPDRYAIVDWEIDQLVLPVDKSGKASGAGQEAPKSYTCQGGVPRERLFGQNRVLTAVQIAKRQFPKPKVVYLARQDIFADALAGGALPDGPILLVPREGANLPADVANYIREAAPQKVMALGGEAAISKEMLTKAAEMVTPHATQDRFAGKDRTNTSILIAQYMARRGLVKRFYVANGEGTNGSPDAVLGGTLKDGAVIIYTKRTVSQMTKFFANQGKVIDVVALGGEKVLPEKDLQQALKDTNLREQMVKRLAGKDRYDTAMQIAKAAYGTPQKVVYIARSDLYADAVTGATLKDGPILLVPKCGDIPPLVKDTISYFKPQKVISLGGEAAVCPRVLCQASGGTCVAQ